MEQEKSPAFEKIPKIPFWPWAYFGALFYDHRRGLRKIVDKYPIFQIQVNKVRYISVCSLEASIELSSDKDYVKSDKGFNITLNDITKLGIFSIPTNNMWRKAHEILTPGFSKEAIGIYFDSMYEVVEDLLAKWHNIPEEKEISLWEDLLILTAHTLNQSAFSLRQSFFSPQTRELNQKMIELLDTAACFCFLPKFLKPIFLNKLIHTAKGVAEGKKFSDKLLQERLDHPEKYEHVKDMLNLMLKTTDKSGQRFTDQEIRDQITVLVGAGTESTNILIYSTIYYLINNPPILQKALEELDNVFGPDLKSKPTLQQMSKLNYISQILDESLRLNNPLLLLHYSPRQDRLFLGKYPVKKEDTIVLQLQNLHRDRSIWGQDSHVYNPDHFLPEAVANRDPNAFKPFGSGMRACIGKQFALLEAKTAISLLFYFYKMEPSEKTKSFHQKDPSNPPRNDFSVKIKKRIPQDRIGHIRQENTFEEKIVIKPLEVDTFKLKTTHQTPFLILYGSNLGMSEEIARRIAKDADTLGFSVKLFPLNDWLQKLPTEGLTVVVTSTYNGLPPDNAQEFATWLEETPLSFTFCRFALFGCGNTLWRTYQNFPRFIEEKFLQKGAVEIYARGESDGNVFGEEFFEKWYAGFWPAVFKEFSITQSLKEIEDQENKGLDIELLLLDRIDYQIPVRENALTVHVDFNRELQRVSKPFTSKRSTRHLELELPKGTSYRPGDYLAVYPQNNPELIKKIIEHFGLDPLAAIRVKEKQHTFLPIGKVVPVEEILTHYVELHEVATRRHIALLARYIECPPEKNRLLKQMESSSYKEQILLENKSIFDLLLEFKACQLPFALFLSILPPLKPRFYSISSSNLLNPHRCSLTVGVLNTPPYQGVCSNYLARLPAEASIQAFVDSQKQHFKLHPKQTPIVMICAGTGFAPFRGFLQEIELYSKEQENGKAILFFGIRHPEVDFIYKEELMKLVESGLLELHMAFSRLEGQPKCYVQDKLWEERERVWQLLEEGGATFYVCGDGSQMVPAVEKTLQRIYSEKTGQAEHESELWFNQMVESNRYIVDSWNTTPTKK